MRLTPASAQVIGPRIHARMGQHACICFVGLHVDDSRRGGDVYVQGPPETAPNLTSRRRCKSELAHALDFNVDLIVQQSNQDLSICKIAERCRVPRCSPLRITETTLTEISRRLVATHQPEQVVLFWSPALGEPDDSSDIDLLVAVSKPAEPASLLKGQRRVSHHVQCGCDVGRVGAQP